MSARFGAVDPVSSQRPLTFGTRNEATVCHAHLFACPMNLLHLPGLSEKIAYAQLLNDASEIAVRDIGSEDPHSHVTPEMREQSMATLVLPAVKPDVAEPVVEIFLKS